MPRRDIDRATTDPVAQRKAQAAIEVALRGLNPLADEKIVNAGAMFICVAAFSAVEALSSKSVLNKQHARLRAGIRDVTKTLREMRQSAYQTVSDELLLDLERLQFELTGALNHRITTKDRGKPGFTGEKPLASLVALQAAVEYERISGKKVTRIVKDGKSFGPFMTFLGEVYNALGIVASVEAQAAAAKKVIDSAGEQGLAPGCINAFKRS